VVQAEQTPALERLPGRAWDVRRYGRNQLWIWVNEGTDDVPAPEIEQP
jgi:hypothetical protein